ncbi:TMEM8A, partial [Cervus elaphus hippelaphus]
EGSRAPWPPNSAFSADSRLVSEQFSQAPQKLAFYSWYGSARLFHFRVPPDTVLLRWLLQVTQGSGSTCNNVETTVYFRYGAPPVINPLGTSFANSTSVQPSFLLKMLQGNASVNVSYPAPGDWFVAAHLPPSSHKIEVKDLDQSGEAGSGPFCLRSFPVLREDMDVVSVRFRPLDRVSVLVQSDMPSVMQLYLNTGMDSGGSLSISVNINQTVIADNTSVVACVTAGSPFLSFNTSLNCTTAFFQGYPLSLSASSPTANLSIPYPETDNWYLSLQVLCPERPEECVQASVLVDTTLYLVPCLNDCGPYGQCLLLRRHGYLYAGCSCRAGRDGPDAPCACAHGPQPWASCWQPPQLGQASAPTAPRWPTGWRGWSCTDNSTAQTVAQQKVATLLLTLSNLVFLAPIAISVQRRLLLEASVYAYTMFFSTFYHACDQPGDAVLCILNYDALQYCDFLGSGVSVWVTVLCMARLKASLKYVSDLLMPADFIPTCAYIFQPDMLVVRVVEMSILEPDVPLPLVLLSQPSYLKVFVPKHTQELRLELQGCVSNGSLGCPVHLTVGSATLPGNFQKVLTCSDPTMACRLLLPSPPWERWLQVTAKSLAGPRVLPTLAALGRALRFACGFPQVYRCGRRRHCYPPSWQRWVFYLLPGFSLAALALTIYTSMMTSENYYYTHSIWHMLLAGSAAFLLPPRDQHTEPWACAQKLTCHYEICKNHRDELYTVT